MFAFYVRFYEQGNIILGFMQPVFRGDDDTGANVCNTRYNNFCRRGINDFISEFRQMAEIWKYKICCSAGPRYRYYYYVNPTADIKNNDSYNSNNNNSVVIIVNNK